MLYTVVIHKDAKSDYGVSVPDLPGCISAGETMDEAVAQIREAIELHLEGLIEDGQAIPQPSSLETCRTRCADAQAFAVVPIDAAKLRSKAVRINITMPERILARIDAAAKRTGETRSGLLATAACAYLLKTPA